MGWQESTPVWVASIGGHWNAKRRNTTWSMHIHEVNGKLTGRAVQLTSLGDILEYTLLGYVHAQRAIIQLHFTRNPSLQAHLELEVGDDMLAGTLRENNASAFPIQFARVIVVNYG